MLFVGCTFPPSEDHSEDVVGRAIQPIISGTPSGAEHDAVVVLAVFQNGTRNGLCTASLVAPNLVLTARHCVSDVDDAALCSKDGTAVEGAGLHGDRNASDLVVFAGKDGVVASLTDETKASARGKKLIVDETATTICNHDLAFVLLDRSIPIPPQRVRLGPPTASELLTVIGFGITETGTLPASRRERTNVPIVALGPALYPGDSRYGFGDGEFMLGESACLGDSGGPAIVKSGAIVGVASRAGNGKPRDPSNLAATCTGPTAHAIYTHLGSAPELVERAFLEAGARPVLDPPDLAATLPSTHGDPGVGEMQAPSDVGDGSNRSPQLLKAGISAEAPKDAASSGDASADSSGCSATPRGASPAGVRLDALALLASFAAAAAFRSQRARRRR